MLVFHNTNNMAINTEINISQLHAKKPHKPTANPHTVVCLEGFSRFCGFVLGILALKNKEKQTKKSSHLQSNQLEHHSLLMPLSYLLSPYIKKIAAGRESYHKHDAIAAFVHLGSV